MARWEKTCKEFVKVREFIDEGENEKILPALLDICKKYAKGKWDFADDFDRLAEDIEVNAYDDDVDVNDIDFYLGEFYDLCNAARVWLEIN